jgi:hypothetical protein
VLSNPTANTPEGLGWLRLADLYVLNVVRPAFWFVPAGFGFEVSED